MKLDILSKKKILALATFLLIAGCSTQPPITYKKTSATDNHTLEQQHIDEHIKSLEQQANNQPSNPEAFFNLGIAYLNEDEANKSTKNHKAALTAFHKVLKLAPGNIATLKAIYDIHYDQAMRGEDNGFKNAKKTFNEIPPAQRNNLNPPSLARFVYLYIVNKETRGKNTIDIYNALLSASVEQPSNDKAYLQLARMYREQTHYPLALATLKLGEESIKDSPELYKAIASTYEAKAELNGCSYEKTTDLYAAIEYYKRAIPLDPDNANLHYHLAQLYIDNNLYPLALNETTIILALDPSAKNLALAAQHYSIIGNQQKANELLERAKNAGLTYSDSAFHEIYMNSGQWQKAASSFTEYLHAQKHINVYDVVKADIIGQQADIEFSMLAKDKNIRFNNEWEAAIFAYWTNKISSNQLEKNVRNSCERTEYYFYSGYRGLQLGNKHFAKQQFASVMQQKTYRFIERPLARYFLTVN